MLTYAVQTSVSPLKYYQAKLGTMEFVRYFFRTLFDIVQWNQIYVWRTNKTDRNQLDAYFPFTLDFIRFELIAELRWNLMDVVTFNIG